MPMKNHKQRDGKQRQRTRSRRRRARAAAWLLLAGFVAAAAGWLVARALVMPGPLTQQALVEIPRGASSSGIAALLEEKGVVRSRWLVLAAIASDRLRGRARPLRAGSFMIPPRASVRDVLRVLQAGKALKLQVVVPEGMSTRRVLQRVRAHPLLVGELSVNPPEGHLLPATYPFRPGATRDELVLRMMAAQKTLLARLWPKRKPGLPITSKREAIILASIVEKETALERERPLVAAVFLNRLRKGMRLQADPTVIYGITRGLPLKRRLTKDDLHAKTPWNTYRIKGLPATPITNPGRAAIAAVLNPADSDMLYFVADGTGGHVFARTLKEHNANVRKWRAFLAQRQKRREERNKRDAASIATQETKTTPTLPMPAAAKP